MSASYAASRRYRYRIDRGYRAARINSTRREQGRPPVRQWRDSYSITEMCGVIGISLHTFRRFEKMGVIPKHTYPSTRRMYWRHQAVLLLWLFDSMRMEGWPRRMPWFVGSRFWTLALTRLNTEWHKETVYGGCDRRWGDDAGESVCHQVGEDTAG